MPGSTNFLQWNPNALNQETDSTYNGESLRSNGIPSGSGGSGVLAPSIVHNKLYYQFSTFMVAMCQWLVNNGFSPNDGNASPTSAVANLASVFQNAVALLSSPQFTGTPTAPTPALGDNSTKLATTQFVLKNLTPIVNAIGNSFVAPKLVIGSFPVTITGGGGSDIGSGSVSFTGGAIFVATPLIVLTPIFNEVSGSVTASAWVATASHTGFTALMTCPTFGTYTVNFIAIGS